MTRPEDVSTADEFNDALADLLVAGAAEGIDVEGAWECRNGAGALDWEVTVTVLVDGADEDG